MELDQQIINFVFSALLVLFGWVLKVLWDSISALQRKDDERRDQVHSLSVVVAGDYVKQEKFDAFTTMVSNKLDRIEQSISFEKGKNAREK